MELSLIIKHLQDKVFYQDSNGIIINGNCLEILPFIPDSSIDLVVTSPPYWDVHNYNNGNEIGYKQSLDEYINSMKDIFQQFHRILKDTGNVLFNIMDLQRGGNLIRLSDLIIGVSPLKLRQRIVWYVPNKVPVVNDRYLVNKFEWILHFVKSDNYTFNPDVLRLPLSHWVKKDKRKWKYNQNGALLGNVWEIPAEHIPNNHMHPAMFPKKLVDRCLMGWSNEGDVVLDPFLGSGTTAIACKKLKRRYIGIEINKRYCEVARKRLYGISEVLF